MKSLALMDLMKIAVHDPKLLESSRLYESAFTRNRKMPFASALTFLLDMRKTTLQTRLNMFFEHNGDDAPMSQQAFSKLRMNFDHTPFVSLHNTIVKHEYSGEYELPLWNGYHIFGIDGSYLQLPRTEELYRDFGTHGQKTQCPAAGISVLFDLLHGWALDPIITAAGMNERAECEKHIDFLCAQLPKIAKNSIVIMDRGYPSVDLLHKLRCAGVKFVVRCNSVFVSEINNAPVGDCVVTLKNGLSVRVVKFALSSGEIETLATNLFDLPENQFPELYAMRWGIETAYFHFKRELCVEKFSGKSPNSIRQDFWASMVLLNAVAVFQREADAAAAERQRDKQLKHQNRARTSDLIVTLRDKFVFAVLCGGNTPDDFDLEKIIQTMARAVSPVRPGRSFPRVHKPSLTANSQLKSHL